MTSPIFSSAFGRKFVVQSRPSGGEWREHSAYRAISAARQAAKELRTKDAAYEVRIVNRITGEVVT